MINYMKITCEKNKGKRMLNNKPLRLSVLAWGKRVRMLN